MWIVLAICIVKRKKKKKRKINEFEKSFHFLGLRNLPWCQISKRSSVDGNEHRRFREEYGDQTHFIISDTFFFFFVHKSAAWIFFLLGCWPLYLILILTLCSQPFPRKRTSSADGGKRDPKRTSAFSFFVVPNSSKGRFLLNHYRNVRVLLKQTPARRRKRE